MNDSGNRTEFANGMVREVNPEKPAFHLMMPLGVPYDEQFLTRIAKHMQKGALKYADRNWEKGISLEVLERARASAMRHMIQWMSDETDEDHAAAVFFNLMQAEYVKYKLKEQEIESQRLSDRPGSPDSAS